MATKRKKYATLNVNPRAAWVIKGIANELGYKSITEFGDALSKANKKNLEFLRVLKEF